MTGTNLRLVGLGVLAALAACTAERDAAESVELAVSRAYVAEPVTGERTAMYLTIINSGDADDELLAVSTSVAETAEIHRTVDDGGVLRMEQVESVSIPAGGSTRMVPGGYHIMLLGLKQMLWSGDHVDATLSFRRLGQLRIRPKVVAYADLEELLETDEPSSHDPH
jgi:copper(I)-binding protein